MHRIAPVRDIWKIKRVSTVQAEWITGNCDRKGDASACRYNSAQFPSVRGPAQHPRSVLRTGNFPGVAEYHIVRLIEVGRPAPQPRIEEEQAGESILKLISIG